MALPNGKHHYEKFMKHCFGHEHAGAYGGDWNLEVIDRFATHLKRMLHGGQNKHMDDKEMHHVHKMLNEVHAFRERELAEEIARARAEEEARKRAAEAKQQHAGQQHQDGWRWCCKCSNMCFSGNGAGVCAKGGGHDFTGSYKYRLPHGHANPHGGSQNNWRWCRKTQTIAFTGNGPRNCAAGGQHDHTGSYDYHLNHKGQGGQNDWRWCKNCQELFHNGSRAKTKCPVSGGNHDPTGSYDYTIEYTK